MKEIKIGDFELHIIAGSHYLSHIFEDGTELCLESCMDGYCVALYNKQKDLIGEKTCTKLGDESYIPFGPKIGDAKALSAAIKLANERMKNV